MKKLSVHIILLLLLFRLCVEGRVFLAVAEISRDLKIDDYAKWKHEKYTELSVN